MRILALHIHEIQGNQSHDYVWRKPKKHEWGKNNIFFEQFFFFLLNENYLLIEEKNEIRVKAHFTFHSPRWAIAKRSKTSRLVYELHTKNETLV